ncbi:MAG: cellulase family glycosylhydrolase [Bacilli bacterium]|nr:cellulase family glycosylhydrolase [Bacilli bacterium]
MGKIVGVNLGNWLVLERWMSPKLFEGTGAEDEVWLSRKLSPEDLAKKLSEHRSSYVTEEDFVFLESLGIEYVRLPIPYFLFGDRPPFPGCIEYVDLALEWGKKHNIKVLLDLHTVPGSQNGYDNGGITGVCKWHKNPIEVQFVLSLLANLAKRYGHHPALYGIEVLNEPISWIVYQTAPSTGKAVDKEEAKGSGYVPMKFLKQFYLSAYQAMRPHLEKGKIIVFHDGFRLTKWKGFFKKNSFEGVALDTHIYVFAMELFVPIARPWVYSLYLSICKGQVRRMEKVVPVLVGEWCISTKYCHKIPKKEKDPKKIEAIQKERFRQILKLELSAWKESSGWFYWNYQLLRDREEKTDLPWKESWDFSRAVKHGWINQNDIKEAKE